LSDGGATLRLELRPSWRLAGLIAGLHAIAGASIFVAIPTAPGALLGMLFLVLGVVAAWDRALLRGRRSPRALLVSADATLAVELADRTRCNAGEGPRTVNRFLVALPLEGATRRSALVVPDMLGPAHFRLLRLWALWGRLPGVASAQLPG
jgi:hypothetical protein